jgi:hypothetical protein
MKRLIAAMAGLTLLVAAPVAATDDPQRGDVCSGLNEPSFICGYVIVTVRVDAEVDDVIGACPPLGAVRDVVQRDFLIAVPVGSEIDLRDCYATQPGVGQANLLYVGGWTDSAAHRPPSAPWLPFVVSFLCIALIALVIPWVEIRRSE